MSQFPGIDMSHFPGMYEQGAFAQVQRDMSRVQAEQAIMLRVPLERTTEPVWPEDEEAEAADRSGTSVPLLESGEADAVLRSISVNLPDLLMPIPPQPSGSPKEVPEPVIVVPGCDHIAFQIPTSYSAPESLVLRRLRLELMLSSDGEVVPVAIFMQPGPDVAVDVRKIGEVSVDVGKILSSLLPQVPAVFTARIGTEIDMTRVHPKIQAAGLQRHECSWRIADSRIAYDFNPVLMAQFSQLRTLTVSAKLHVEVRKRVLGLFHKTYGKSASPRVYMYFPGAHLMPGLSKDIDQERRHSIVEQQMRRSVDEYMEKAASGQDPGVLAISKEQLLGEEPDCDETEGW